MTTATFTGRDCVRAFSDLTRADVPFAGGKGANLGELTHAGLPVPPGFVVGAPAYAAFCDSGDLRARISAALADVDVDDAAALDVACRRVQRMIGEEPAPEWLEQAIRAGYAELSAQADGAPVAVRSSATAEDTESASFAGMNETFLNVRGEDAVLDAVRRCWASLFGPRTVYYRAQRGFGQADMDIAVVVQRQIASTRAGVMFTIDPASGRTDQLVIEGSFGLGEAVVSGSVSPDRYIVAKDPVAIVAREIHSKELVIEPVDGGGTETRLLTAADRMRPTLSDDEVRTLAGLAIDIERHYGSAQDTEWAFDLDGDVWMLQSRPVTASGGTTTSGNEPASAGAVLLRGLGAAPGTAAGTVALLTTLADSSEFHDGEVLVTHMTAPDWVPLMRRAAAVVTDSGGMTCHAAIVSRELGVPCVVGTGNATSVLRNAELVTVDAGAGTVTEGDSAPAAAPAPDGPQGVASAAPVTGTKILVNLSEPSQVQRAAALDVEGVGLLRAELMVLEALDGAASAAAHRGGSHCRVHRPHGGRADDVRLGVRAPTDHLSDDRLPHQRVLGASGRRPVRATRGQPDDRLSRRPALHVRA